MKNKHPFRLKSFRKGNAYFFKLKIIDYLISACSTVVSISRCQRGDPGSNPGRRIWDENPGFDEQVHEPYA